MSPLASRKRILDVLMSGNSGRNWTSTSLMPNWPRAGCSLMLCFPYAYGAPPACPMPPRGTVFPRRFAPQSRRCRAPPACSCVVLCAPAARISRGRSRVKVLAGQEQQPELTDLNLVPPGQLRLLDTLPVDVRAVEAAHVPDGEEGALAVELRVPS